MIFPEKGNRANLKILLSFYTILIMELAFGIMPIA